MAFQIPALRDAWETLKYRRAVLAYGAIDIANRYQRTVLGPFWMIATSFIWVATVGIAASLLFKQNLVEFLPYITVSVLCWSYFMGLMLEGPTIFLQGKQYLHSMKIPYHFYVFRYAMRNYIVLLHAILISIVICVVLQTTDYWRFLIVIPVSVLFLVISITFGMILGLVGTIFRDLIPIMILITNIFVIITPIFWKKDFIEGNDWFVAWNPVYHALELYRSAFIYETFAFTSLYFMLGFLAISIMLSGMLFSCLHKKIPYYV